MEAAAAVVDAIDRRAMASHRKVTRALAAEILARSDHNGLPHRGENLWTSGSCHQTFILVSHTAASPTTREWHYCHYPLLDGLSAPRQS